MHILIPVLSHFSLRTSLTAHSIIKQFMSHLFQGRSILIENKVLVYFLWIKPVIKVYSSRCGNIFFLAELNKDDLLKRGPSFFLSVQKQTRTYKNDFVNLACINSVLCIKCCPHKSGVWPFCYSRYCVSQLLNKRVLIKSDASYWPVNSPNWHL